MADELEINPGALATGWTIYGNIFDPNWTGSSVLLDTLHTVWNGTAFVTDSWAARALGAIALIERTTGHFYGDFPTLITTPGIYPVVLYHQLTGSTAPQTDQAVLYDGQTITWYGAAGVGDLPPVLFKWHPYPSIKNYRQKYTLYLGSGRPITFKRTDGELPTPGTYTLKLLALSNLSVSVLILSGLANANTGDITFNPTIANSSALTSNGYYIAELWRIDGDDNTDALASLQMLVVY